MIHVNIPSASPHPSIRSLLDQTAQAIAGTVFPQWSVTSSTDVDILRGGASVPGYIEVESHSETDAAGGRAVVY